ncbi:erythromycin esterase family protein [Streptomyces sp. NPDC048361]|uniref:erythromycin esterase family protein n=1 Tax=Streptomyces sp. NPDC048361 TaxID=3154720 RepID=UPI00344A86B3
MPNDIATSLPTPPAPSATLPVTSDTDTDTDADTYADTDAGTDTGADAHTDADAGTGTGAHTDADAATGARIDTEVSPPPRPFSDGALDELAANLADGAEVVGAGESTRFSRETFGVRDALLRRLVVRHGFRALAVQDSAGIGAELDRYVHGGPGTAASALADAWRPWRTEEMAGTLEWIRAFNRSHPENPVRIFGVKPVQARPADYDAVLDHVREHAPALPARAASHLDPIRTAHRSDEHVQRARGTHPGRPFADHARDALELVHSLPETTGHEDVVARMRLIVDFHERSVAGRGSFAGEPETQADAIAGFRERTGLRVVYWDGIAHTAAARTGLGMAPGSEHGSTVGSALRGRLGIGYASLAIGFHHGDLGTVAVPHPAPDTVDARLGAVDLPAHWLDLRGDTARRDWAGPAKLRVISGVYDPSRDALEHLTVGSLTDAFDVLVHIREASAVRRLP